MTLIEIFLIAVGTSMAPFSLGVTNGAALKRPSLSNAAKMGLFFGGAHALLLLLGWIIGVGLRDYISAWDHWVVFGLLGFLGGEMIVEAVTKGGGQAEVSIFDSYGMRGSGASALSGRRTCRGYARKQPQFSGAAALEGEGMAFETYTLLLLSIAISLDALAIGLSFSMMDVGIAVPTVIIGAVVFAFTLMGFPVGSRAGDFIKNRIGILGGLVLIGIGLKVLLEHLG